MTIKTIKLLSVLSLLLFSSINIADAAKKALTDTRTEAECVSAYNNCENAVGPWLGPCDAYKDNYQAQQACKDCYSGTSGAPCYSGDRNDACMIGCTTSGCPKEYCH